METLIFDMKPRRAGKTELELKDALLEISRLKGVILNATHELQDEILSTGNQGLKFTLNDINEPLKAAIE